MKSIILATAAILILSSFAKDTTVSQVRKIEIKAAQIKAKPQLHSTEDVYNLLTMSTNLTRSVVRKSDSINYALIDTKKDLRQALVDNQLMLKNQSQLVEMVASTKRTNEPYTIYINTMRDIAFWASLVSIFLWVLRLALKKSYPELFRETELTT